MAPDAKWACAACGGELEHEHAGMTSLWPHKYKCTKCGTESKWCSDPWEAIKQIGKQAEDEEEEEPCPNDD